MSEKTNEEMKEKKRPGRKPMTPEEKAAAAKARAEEKEKASNLKPEYFMQFQGVETNLNTLVIAAKSDFRTIKKRTPITDVKLYIKPAEHLCYYVINEKFEGKISF